MQRSYAAKLLAQSQSAAHNCAVFPEPVASSLRRGDVIAENPYLK
jgi:hypothetical protein